MSNTAAAPIVFRTVVIPDRRLSGGGRFVVYIIIAEAVSPVMIVSDAKRGMPDNE
jgi:hypothetical protein